MNEKWMTIPEWDGIEPINLTGREQDELPGPDDRVPKNLHVLVRGRIELQKGEYQLLVTADDHYMLWIDGNYQGQGPVPSHPCRSYYDTYPVAGGKTVTVSLHLYYQGLVNRVWNSGDGKFGVWLSVQHQGQEISHCDEGWRYQICTAYSGQTIGYDTQFLENFDSRLYPEGWEQPGYDDSYWGHLCPATWKAVRLESRPILALQEYEKQPVSTKLIPGGLLLDFGREITGTLCAEALGFAGTQVEIRYGEELDLGRVRFQMRCNCCYRETWILSGGNNRLHAYDYKAFRFVELQFRDDAVITNVFARIRHYPMENRCRLVCPTDQLEDIFEICKNAVLCCTQEGFLDCPSREKGQYLGDAIITARSQIWLTGSTEMLRKCIRDFMDSQSLSSALMAVSPGNLMQEIADFSLLFPILPLTEYAFTGDKEFLAECYPAVNTMTEGFLKYQRTDGLLENVGELWNLVDWPENLRDNYDFPLTRPVVGKGCHNVINALWYGANQMQEEIEQLLGLPITGRTQKIAAAFHGAFYRSEQKLYADSEVSNHCSLHANLYPAFLGILPKEAEDVYERMLLEPNRVCGAIPTYFALRSLGRLGRMQTFYRLLTRKDAYGWRNMLQEGATAAFEAWGKNQKWNTSLCHGWNSGPISLFIEELAGVKPVAGSLVFHPCKLDSRPDFLLTLPWNGEQIKVKQIHGAEPKLERM